MNYEIYFIYFKKQTTYTLRGIKTSENNKATLNIDAGFILI